MSKILGSGKYITNAKGDVEYVILPSFDNQRRIGLLEDYGLGLAMKEAEGDRTYDKEQALRFFGRCLESHARKSSSKVPELL